LRQRGRPKIKWEGNVKQDLKVIKNYHWGEGETESRKEWKRITEQAETHKELE
jgi:hypothetical protein